MQRRRHRLRHGCRTPPALNDWGQAARSPATAAQPTQLHDDCALELGERLKTGPTYETGRTAQRPESSNTHARCQQGGRLSLVGIGERSSPGAHLTCCSQQTGAPMSASQNKKAANSCLLPTTPQANGGPARIRSTLEACAPHPHPERDSRAVVLMSMHPYDPAPNLYPCETVQGRGTDAEALKLRPTTKG